ncbi:Interferon-induced guanylate-binding protein 2 [Stylophora pistillata]|uniref:Interferon-induced guanylate-binding protein 2 n=1 Tax=Stylophora pistillata TaxID=50429 RepID=A0A2B4SPT3_STYPI|nr:Interferon-induced guanylate-binding protein 2 [Stylophora pistillata]
MKRPIQVIAAVGNARVGKSTFLNLITRIFNREGKSNAIEEVFKSGASLDPVTRGVWAHVIQHPDKNGSILLLDVQGTDLGNDRVTHRLSMFTALLTSGLNIFALQVVKNGDIDFLYRIARLSELVFEGKDLPNNFPKLRIVLRTNLDVPDDDSFEDYVGRKIFHPDGQSKGKEKTIEKYFPRGRITVSLIPSVNNPPELFTDIKQLQESSSWKSFETLLQKMKDCPVKSTFGGLPIDGEELSFLTIKLVEAMNSPDDSWEDFGIVYATMERYICTRRYEKYIKPALLCLECSLPNEISKGKEELISALKEKRKREEEKKKKTRRKEKKIGREGMGRREKKIGGRNMETRKRGKKTRGWKCVDDRCYVLSVQLAMIYLLLIASGTLISYSGFVNGAEAGKAKILLNSVNNKISPNAFELNPDALKEISQMKRPIQVIAATGNARVGKSTLLNLVAHNLDENRTSSAIVEVFKTGDSVEAVTRGVWGYIIHHRDGKGSMLLLDVEGTDLGDDSVTDRLSMFTAMMSSSLNVFAENFLGNNDIDFLYRLARLSELVFKDKYILKYFPKLQIVLRTNLDVKDGDYDFEKIIKINAHKGKEDALEMIYKFFPKYSIAVTRIPIVFNATELFKDQLVLESSSEWKAFKPLIEKMKECPEKRTFEGNAIGGEALRDLAKGLVQGMNTNSWEYFGNAYETWERDICRKSYKEHIEPVLTRRTSIEIQNEMMEALDEFKLVCELKSETDKAKDELKRRERDKRKVEDEERRKQEEDKRKQEEERREREEEKRRWEEEKRRLEEEKRRLEEERRRREEEKRKQEENSWWEYAKNAAKYFTPGFIAGAYFLSDEDLKDNVTTLSCSEFNDIGLRGVCWEWNDNAQRTFGLTGEDCGVIAQEVKVVYPWAVAEGMDGYLRVHYGMLLEMINVAHSNSNSSRFS